MSFRIVLASFALTSTFFAQTWADDVAPIIYDNCTICHRPDESGPFPLLSYRDVSKRAKMIKRITADRDMPPWHPVEGHGEFVGAMRLSAEEIATLGRWADAGAPEGDATRAPEPPSFASGWALGPPDLIVEMSEVFEVPADGPDIYRNFVIPLGLERDVHLAAIDVRPSARTVLHHTIFELDQTGYARRRAGRCGKPGFSGMEGGGAGRDAGRGDDLDFGSSGVGGWAVGGQARRLPLGLGRHVPAGSDLVLRSHFHPSGKPEKEKTTLGLYFTPEPPSRKLLGVQLPTAFGVYAGLDIPAGQADFEIKDDFVLPVDCLALSVGGHAHQVCREMQLEVEAPDGQKRSLFLIDDWKFNWQNRYQYREPVPLAAGTRVSARILYDNSADNPQNPYVPPRRIRWGLQSNDEMGSVTLLLVAQNESESEALAKALRQKIRSV
ncbi:MAG: hypothetical protein KDB18_07325, partial [Salinibacterium sp.]|nr:hypothetical protein [Salinibacterium sp.]